MKDEFPQLFIWGGPTSKVPPWTSTTSKPGGICPRAIVVVGAHALDTYDTDRLMQIHDFCTTSSSFYPSLARWYDEANYEWLANEVRRRTGTEREE